MSHAYKSQGCEASYCTKQLYAAGLCRKHYETSTAAHPAGKCSQDASKTEALLLENLSLSIDNDRLTERIDVMHQALSRIGFVLDDVIKGEAPDGA